MFYTRLMEVLDSAIPVKRRLDLAKQEVERIAIAEDALERQRLIALHTRYIGASEAVESEAPGFSPDEEIDLSVARTNKVIWDRPGKGIFIRYADRNITSYTRIRFDNPAAPSYPVLPGYMRVNFKKIYLTNTAQAGKTFAFVVGYQNITDYGMLDIARYNLRDALLEPLDHIKLNNIRAATASTIYNITVTNADTEYSQALPAGTKNLKANLVDNTAFRYAWVTGKVATPTAPYGSQPANVPLEKSGIYLSSKTLYFAAPAGTKTMMIETLV